MTTEIEQKFDALAPNWDRWQRKNAYYHRFLGRLIGRFVPPGNRVLEIGCASGDLLATLKPSVGYGVDPSGEMLKQARSKHTGLIFEQASAEDLSSLNGTTGEGTDQGGTSPQTQFDYVVMSDLLGHLDDILVSLAQARNHCAPGGTLVVTYYNFLWQPLIGFLEKLRLKTPLGLQNWVSFAEMKTLLELAGFQVTTSGTGLLLPKYIPGLAELLNGPMSRWPVLRSLCFIDYVVATPAAPVESQPYTTTVLIPCRNEAGNMAECIRRTPQLGPMTEIMVVDGDSTDGTVEVVEAEIAANALADGSQPPHRKIRLIHQTERSTIEHDSGDSPDLMLRLGKGDAVRKGYAAATGDVLMILDADMTVPPEDLVHFYSVMAEGRAEFVNGSRLVYPLEDGAMKFVNLLGNKFFSRLFSWMLSRPITDTLCGTKAMLKKDYDRLAANRAYFGDFDPFGDFDLLFGAARLGLSFAQVPVHYKARVAGDSKVRAFKHGQLLIKMSAIGIWKLKILPLFKKTEISPNF